MCKDLGMCTEAYASLMAFGQIFEIEPALFDNVWPSSGGMLSFCCLDIDVLSLDMYIKGY